ncbi:MAG: isopenicillin N synthase family oxygenase [Pseudomonadales bacterium]|nr:isopenicillin N synthase family oxygenase [Pseudomonadales bacterium]
MPSTLPIIDVSCYLDKNPDDPTITDVQIQIATDIGAACRTSGFFYLKGHGILDVTFQQLENISKQFFSLSLEEKMDISMQKGGRAWRGYFPPGAELTSGKADQKEGIYFGTELSNLDPRVIAQTPLHGQNLWPDQLDMQKIVMSYIKDVTEVAQAVLKGIALSLGLVPNYFRDTYTADPTVLFRVFNYPPRDQNTDVWGVGEHTDYGLLTLLAQDQHGGLEVYSQGNWISAPPIENYIICNIGDMLDKLTAGRYVSTPHRVRVQKDYHRLSFPLFLDPGFNAEIQPLPNSQLSISPLPTSERVQTKLHRWDNADLHSLKGTYGEYLLNKVSKVFPHLTTDLS